MKQKVAILTQPLHTNYGGTLQAYALQKTIKDMGVDVVTLNYQWKTRNGFRFILAVIKNHLLNRKEKFPFLPKEQILREQNHRKFIEKNIVTSKVIFSEDELLRHFKEENYDSVVVGSDQVWRVEYSPNIDNFFLNFLDDSIRKIAYAASFGLDTWQFTPEKTAQIKNWLEKFDVVSVREDSASVLCKEFLDIQAEHVLDPTLLLTKEHYTKLIEDIPVMEKGVFTYILDKSREKDQIVNLVSDKFKLKTFTKQPIKNNKTELFITNEQEYVYPKIEEWISAFRDASFIVTDSFHGMVFSIIFNKPFIAVANKERGNSRFISLLSWLDLEYRLVNTIEEITDKHFITPEFDRINDIIKKKRELCKNLIFKGLN